MPRGKYVVLLTLMVPLSGCATLGLYDRLGKGIGQTPVEPSQSIPKSHAPTADVTDQRENAAYPSLAEQAEKLRQQRDTASAEAFIEWLRKNEEYVRDLCSKPGGHEWHVDAYQNIRFAVSADPRRYAEAVANGYGYRVANCPSVGQSVLDANPLSEVLARTSAAMDYNKRVREKHRELQLVEEGALRLREEQRRREEQERRAERETQERLAQQKRERQDRVAKISNRINRVVECATDFIVALFIYGAVKDTW